MASLSSRRRALQSLLLGTAAAVTIPSALAGCASSRLAVPPMEMAILHSGDGQGRGEPCSCKGQLGGLARRASAVKREREQGAVLLLEAGNVFSGVDALELSAAETGASVVAAMNAMGYDAMAIGDVDAAAGPELLAACLAGADFPVLSANLTVDGELLAQPYAVLERQGISTAVLGLTGLPRRALATGMDVTDPLLAVRRFLPELRRQASIVVILGALGASLEQRLLSVQAGVDVLVGGAVRGPAAEVSRAPAPVHVAVGYFGEYLGLTTLMLDRDGSLAAYSFRLLPLDASFADDPTVAGLLQG
ncbi:MAG: bifunctional UDP-sugar hydrolase/5'-nucleotidase [Anaerolineae bacterium]